MVPKKIVEHLLSAVMCRKEILDSAIDRGLGEGMQIEKWILIEMVPRLKELRSQGTIERGESEHKYPIKKSTRYEHSDIWWQQEGQEHWLEVKTIVLTAGVVLGSTNNIANDLDKMDRLRAPDHYHHLGVVFPMQEDALPHWRDRLAGIYGQHGLSFEGQWEHALWEGKCLYLALYGRSGLPPD
jgi:hypothetical protein